MTPMDKRRPAQGLKPSQHNDMIAVSRAELQHEHDWLIARLHKLRRKLGYPPLQTGKQQRREQDAR